MRVDARKSAFREDPAARDLFDVDELEHMRFLLRRLQFLEAQVRERGGMSSGESGGGVFAALEIKALDFVLSDLGFLLEVPAVSGNDRR